MNQKIIFFDGVCHLCNGFVDFVIQNETSPPALKFAPLQGETAQKFLSTEERSNLQSVLYLENGTLHRESEAVLKILAQLKSPWKWIGIFAAPIPRFARDAIYRRVARNRYSWFGKRETCRLPAAHEKNQLLP